MRAGGPEYRVAAEQFHAELAREYYSYLAGIKGALEIEAIHARHAGLFTREAVDRLRDDYEGAERGSFRRRQCRMLLDFASEHYIGAQIASAQARRARRESELRLEIDGAEVGYRSANVVLATTADPEERIAIHAQLLQLIDGELNPLTWEVVEGQQAGASDLGFASYAQMCAELKAIDLDGLSQLTAAFTDASAARFPPVVGPELRASLGYDLDAMSRADLFRFARSPDLDANFAGEYLLPSLYETLGGLGIDVCAQPNVHLDLEPRPAKTARAFSAVVSLDEIYLVISPGGGHRDFNALFHEAGHAQHFAHMDRATPFEVRCLGDIAITEAFAYLFEHLEMNPLWLERRARVSDPQAVMRRSIAYQAMTVRQQCARLAYELELYGASAPSGLPERHGALMTQAVGFDWPQETYLTDIDPGFYCSAYLRARALEPSLRRVLIERFDESWFEQPGAGALLREWWSTAQQLSAEEFLYEVTGETLDFQCLIADLTLA